MYFTQRINRSHWYVMLVAGSLAALLLLLFTTRSAFADADSISTFGPATKWHDFFCIGGEACAIGDFNGDNQDDIVAFVRDTKVEPGRGDVYVALSAGTGFGPAAKWHEFFCIGEELCAVGDFDGDGHDDIATFVRDTKVEPGRGDVYVALSTGTGFDPASTWHGFFCIGAEVCAVGDFNGDGRDDIATFVRDTKAEPGRGDVYVALSTGTGFGTSTKWHDSFCLDTEVCAVGNFNGDNRDDIVVFRRDTATGPGQGDVWVALSTGVSFGPSSIWHSLFCIGEEVCAVGDFNDDGKDDIVTFVRDTKAEPGRGDIYVALSGSTNFGPSSKWHDFFCVGAEVCAVGDFNGDGAYDIVTFLRDTQAEPGRGDVYVAFSREFHVYVIYLILIRF